MCTCGLRYSNTMCGLVAVKGSCLLIGVCIPQDVGIWLETDWYRRQAVIKEIKKDSYAFTSTDVHVRYHCHEWVRGVRDFPPRPSRTHPALVSECHVVDAVLRFRFSVGMLTRARPGGLAPFSEQIFYYRHELLPIGWDGFHASKRTNHLAPSYTHVLSPNVYRARYRSIPL